MNKRKAPVSGGLCRVDSTTQNNNNKDKMNLGGLARAGSTPNLRKSTSLSGPISRRIAPQREPWGSMPDVQLDVPKVMFDEDEYAQHEAALLAETEKLSLFRRLLGASS